MKVFFWKIFMHFKKRIYLYKIILSTILGVLLTLIIPFKDSEKLKLF